MSHLEKNREMGGQLKRSKYSITQFICISQPCRTFSFHKHKVNTALTEGGSYLGTAPSHAGWDTRNQKKTGKVQAAPRNLNLMGKAKFTCVHTSKIVDY